MHMDTNENELPDPAWGVPSMPTIPEGFIPWAGGECPVPGDQFVDILTRENGTTSCMAMYLNWQWGSDSWTDIIAYRPDPNYVVPINWQARALEIEEDLRQTSKTLDYVRAKAEKLATALRGIMEWAGPIAGDNNDDVSAEEEISSADLARAALAEWEGKP